MNEEKKLYRSSSDRIIFGVCGGLADYFRIDPVIIRVLFVLLVLADGIGFIIYIILAIAVPVKPGESNGDRKEKLNEFAQSVGDKAKELAGELKLEKECCSGNSRKKIFGTVLIIVGSVILINRIFNFDWLEWRFIFPALIVAFGLYIIFKK